MALRRKQCRAHGGIFSYHPKKGRQPVSCKPEFPCDRADTPEYKVGDTVTVGGIKFTKHAEPPESFAEAPKPANPSLTLAKAAKERLVALGWVVKGKAKAEGGRHGAEITCSRGTELLIMRWLDGELVTQEYALEPPASEDTDSPVAVNRLHFNPTDLTDSELVRMIRGMRVTYWNTLAGKEQTYTVGNKVTIEHMFRENGDEDNGKRIVKFIDHDGHGFRAFDVSALLKVG